MEEKGWKVYAQINPAGEVTRIYSDAFEEPGEGAVLIGEGNGDKYAHAQSRYLAKDIRDFVDKVQEVKILATVDNTVPPTLQAGRGRPWRRFRRRRNRRPRPRAGASWRYCGRRWTCWSFPHWEGEKDV